MFTQALHLLLVAVFLQSCAALPVIDLHPAVWGHGLLPPAGAQRYWIDHRDIMIPIKAEDSRWGVSLDDDDLWELNVAGEAGLSTCEYSIGYKMYKDDAQVVVREGGFGDKEGGATTSVVESIDGSGVSPSKTSSVLFIRGDEVAAGAEYVVIHIDQCYLGRYVVRMEFEEWNGQAYLMDWSLGKWRNQQSTDMVDQYRRLSSLRNTGSDTESFQNPANAPFNLDTSFLDSGQFSFYRDSSVFNNNRGWFNGAFPFNFNSFANTNVEPVLELWWYPQAKEEEIMQVYTCAAGCDDPTSYTAVGRVHVQGAHSRSSFARMFYKLPIGGAATRNFLLLAWISPHREAGPDDESFSRAMVPDYARVWDTTRTGSPVLMDVGSDVADATLNRGSCRTTGKGGGQSHLFQDSMEYLGTSFNVWRCIQRNFNGIVEVRWETPASIVGLSHPWLQWYEYTFGLSEFEYGYELSMNDNIIFNSVYNSFKGGLSTVTLGAQSATFGSFGYDVQVGLGVEVGREHIPMKVRIAAQTAAFANSVPVFQGMEVDPCATNMCQNEGKCYPMWFGYDCVCATGFSGDNCEINDDDCVQNSCKNEGECVDSETDIGMYTCDCSETEYEGEFCEKRKTNCPLHLSAECLNGGTCQSLPDGAFSCACVGDWDGDFCEHDTNECHLDPFMCKNGGSCMPTGAVSGPQTRCDCTGTGYTGSACTVPEVCDPNPCKNGGYCVMDANTQAASCICTSIWFGPWCEDNSLAKFQEDYDCRALNSPGRDEFSPFHECMNGGICKNNPDIASQVNDHWECDCPQGFTGTWCEVGNLCEHADPCMHGYCMQEGFETTCICDGTHFGEFCEDSIADFWNDCRTASMNCLNGGVCSEHAHDKTHACVCNGDYTGARCEMPHVCSNYPCLNYGECYLGADGTAQCGCRDGYAGLWCEKMAEDLVIEVWNEYTSDCRFAAGVGRGCGENGECTTRASGAFACVCNAGWAGPDCSLHLACDPNPCLNGGRCSLVNNQATCYCTGDFDGDNCEIDLNDYFTPTNCLIKDCMNGGVCDLSYLTCNCPNLWRGPFCEESAACFPNPCENSGRCSLDSFGAAQCLCPGGWYGKYCSHELVLGNSDIDDCRIRPCSNGECSSFQGTFQCRCSPGWTGTRCDTLIACVPNPCSNGGQCFDFGGQPTCACSGAWHGALCAEGIEDSFDDVSVRLSAVIKESVSEAVSADADDDVGSLSFDGETRAALLNKLNGQVMAFGDSLAGIQESLAASNDELAEMSRIYARKSAIQEVQDLLNEALRV